MVEVDLWTSLAVGAIILLIYHYVAKQYEYFLTKPVPCMKPTYLLGSSASTVFRFRDFGSHVCKMYNTYPDSKFVGFYDFMNPTYMVRDPELVKKITVKDFDYFTDHTPTMTNANTDESGDALGSDSLFGNSLFALRGQRWRDMRATLSPAFTGSKMRHIFGLVSECGQSLTKYFADEAKAGKVVEVEMKDVFSRFGNDVIATVAFGITVDSHRERENEFYVKGKQMLGFQNAIVMVKIILLRAMPKLMRKLKVDFVSADLTDYFKNMIISNMKQREAHGIVRNDMINMLMELRKGTLKHQKEEQDAKDAGFATVEESSVGKATHSRVWTQEELIAQCFLFFVAGFDTFSTGTSFLIYELTVNPDIQNRLYAEVLKTDQALDGKPLTYEVLQQMEYLDMVVSEGLRKWPPALLSDRYCVKDYKYDDGTGGTRFVIEKGRSIWIPTFAIHRDPRYYPDPEKFDPERFSEKNRANINTGAYLPFGSGPRNCIGSRLALMEIKSIVYYLLKEFSFEPTAKTQVPLKLAKVPFALLGEKGIWLQLKPRNK